MLLGVSLVFTVLGILTVSTGTSSGWIAIAFFGVGSLVLLATLVRPSTLVLREDSFTYGTVFRSTTLAWSDVADFGLTDLRGKRVGIKLVGQHHSRLRGANVGLTGYEEVLPANYGLAAEQLLNLLNEWREKRRP